MSRNSPIILLAVATLAGCSADSELQADGDTADYDTTVDDGVDTDSTGPTDETDSDPTWWSIGGELEVLAGEVDPLQSVLVVGFSSAEADLCPLAEGLTGEVVLQSATASPPPDDTPVYAWWTLELAAGEQTCPGPLPATLEIGIGAMDSRLYGSMEANGIDADSTGPTTYAVYARVAPEAPVYVFGVAGTPGNYAGTDAAVEVLVDGRYSLQTLYLLPLAE